MNWHSRLPNQVRLSGAFRLVLIFASWVSGLMSVWPVPITPGHKQTHRGGIKMAKKDNVPEVPVLGTGAAGDLEHPSVGVPVDRPVPVLDVEKKDVK
jgi:hypothetical protein